MLGLMKLSVTVKSAQVCDASHAIFKLRTFAVVGSMEKLVALIILLAFVSNTCLATTDTESEIERIDVIGKKPLVLMKRDMIRAEDEFYDLYNELVEYREMRMDCEMQSLHNFTRVKKRTCKPKFLEAIKNDEMDKAIDRAGGRNSIANIMNAVPDIVIVRQRVKEKNIEMANVMSELINKNKNLAEKYAKWLDAKNKYEAAKHHSD